MSIKDKIKDTIKVGIDDVLTPLRTGEILKRDLGLNKFQFIWIQKVINSSINIFIITVDSRYPSVYLSRSKLDKLEFSTLEKIKQSGSSFKFDNFSLTPAIDLDEFNGRIPSNSMILFRDLGGYYFSDSKMYESTDLEIIQKMVLEESKKVPKIFSYQALFERRLSSYKAWYSPLMDKFYQFNTNLIHDEIASSLLGTKGEEEAFRKGYIRIYVYENLINIQSIETPDSRVFLSLQYHLNKNSFPAKIKGSIWSVERHKDYLFPHQSFFFAEDISEAKIIK